MGTINDEGVVIRHPLAYIVEAADDIAYMTADLEDAVKSGIVSVNDLLYFLRIHMSHWEKNTENLNSTLKELERLLINWTLSTGQKKIRQKS